MGEDHSVMPNDKLTMSGEFGQPWPGVLIDIRDWIQHQAALAGSARRMEVRLNLSRALLNEAKARGKTLQPQFDNFRRKVAGDFALDIELEGLHDSGPHRVEFFCWR